MKKDTIGRVQLWIGAILLIVGIIGVILFITFFKHHNTIPGVNNSSEYTVTEALSILSRTSEYLNLGTLDFVLLSTSIITIFISLLFITQGLANKSETIKQK